MLGFIEQLQKRPEAERRTIALSLAGGITAVIFILWLMGTTLYSSPPATEVTTEPEQGPFAALGEGLSSFWDDTASAVHALRQKIGGSPESFSATSTP